MDFRKRPPPLHAGADFSELYARLLPICRDVAWLHGYALATHGTMRRDMDVIAVPWVDACADPLELAQAMAGAVFGTADWENTGNKPHGRLAWNIVIFKTERTEQQVLDGCAPWLDLSVIPPVRSKN